MTPFKEGQEERIKAAVSDTITKYVALNRDFGFNMVVLTQDNREHIINIGTSILSNKWEIGYGGGSFIQAIVDNNLSEVFGRADDINVNCIRFYVSLMYNQGYIS